jgi:hypothetical protein
LKHQDKQTVPEAYKSWFAAALLPNSSSIRASSFCTAPSVFERGDLSNCVKIGCPADRGNVVGRAASNWRTPRPLNMIELQYAPRTFKESQRMSTMRERIRTRSWLRDIPYAMHAANF